jgi:hypothetical protein
VPRMLGVIFRAPAVDQHGLPENLLQTVDFDDEADLLRQSFAG